MAVIETLEIRFQADMGKLSGELEGLAGRIDGLGQALEAGKVNLSSSAAGLIQSIAAALRSGALASTAPQEAGNALVRQFSSALSGGTAQASLAARSVSAAAKFSNSGAVSAARSAGAALGQGFANGISSKYGAVMQAANRIANAAVSRIRSALSIHSPSRVSFQLGGWFGEGFAGGVLDSLDQVERSAAALSQGASNFLARQSALLPEIEGASAALGGRAIPQDMNITIPMYVDGMKLGEASIRGINQVTRSAGKVLLEI